MQYMQNPIDLENIKIIGKIGHGAYGDVFKVQLVNIVSDNKEIRNGKD